MPAELSKKEIVTVPCRLSFPALFEPKPVASDSDEKKYQAVVLLPPETDLAPFYECVKAAMVEKFGKAIKLSPAKNPIRDCAEKLDLAGYEEGWHYINTKAGFQPQVVDQKRQAIIDAERIFPGCWCRFHLIAYAWSHKTGGKGVSFSLEAVQLVKEDERFDGRRDAAELFDPIGDVDGDEELFTEDGDDASELFA